MIYFGMKMSFAFLYTVSISISFTCGYVAQKIDQEDEVRTNFKYLVLKNFVEKIKTRISYGKDVAVYKWINGEPILDQNRENFVLVNAEKTAQEMNIPFGPNERLFFIDLMEATKLIEYALVSDWYANEIDGNNTPAGSVSLDQTRQKISEMQVELINYLSQLKDLQRSKNCQRLLAKAIAETKTKNSLLLRALQRAFGNFCQEYVDHRFA